MELVRLISKKSFARACRRAFSLSRISPHRIFLHGGISAALCEKVPAFICITLTRLTLTFPDIKDDLSLKREIVIKGYREVFQRWTRRWRNCLTKFLSLLRVAICICMREPRKLRIAMKYASAFARVFLYSHTDDRSSLDQPNSSRDI